MKDSFKVFFGILLFVVSFSFMVVSAFAVEVPVEEVPVEEVPVEEVPVETVTDEVIINADKVILNTEEEEEPVSLQVYAVDTSPLQGGYYIDCDTRQLGVLRIYVPINYTDGFLTLTNDGNLFNLSSSTVTCAAWNSNGTQYTVRFTSFSEPQYRLYDYVSSQYYDLNVSQISDTNVRILKDNPQIALDINFVYLFIIFALLVVILCQFMKR